MKLLIAALLCAAVPAQEDDRLKRIVERIEKEIRESHQRTLREIREIVRAEIRKIPAAPAPARKRALLGITAGDLTDADRQAAGVEGGIRIEAVRGPAEEAGLKPGDILVELDGKPATESMLRELAEKRAPGDVVDVGIVRLKKRESIKITLGERRD